MEELTHEEICMILQSLEYTKEAFSRYKDYPSFEFKLKRITDVDKVIEKVRAIKRGEKLGL